MELSKLKSLPFVATVVVLAGLMTGCVTVPSDSSDAGQAQYQMPVDGGTGTF